MSFATVFVVGAFAQGTVNFANFGVGLNAPVYYRDGTTKVAGNAITAELLAGSSHSLLQTVATTGFLTGAAAGYFQGGVVTLNFIVSD